MPTIQTLQGILAVLHRKSNMWSWGDNSKGQLGVGSIINKSSPVQVGSRTAWSTVSHGGVSAVGVKSDGTLWTWGANTWGQLGIGSVVSTSSPVQVGSLTNWKQVSMGYGVTGTGASGCAVASVKTDGTLWVWGTISWTIGGLYVVPEFNKSSPVQMGLLTNWKQVSSGNACMAAVKTDGTLWTWGYEGQGQLGRGPISGGGWTLALFKNSPGQVGSGTNWKQVYTGGSVSAIKTDGTLWVWGYNLQGQLGLGSAVNVSTPVQVGSFTDWKDAVSASSFFGIRNNGTLWACGYNSSGQLGIGSTANKNSHVQVGTLTDWDTISNYSSQTAAAIKTDGTLWIWGANTLGELGIGSIANKSSPVQVGTLNTWQQISCGWGSIVAIGR